MSVDPLEGQRQAVNDRVARILKWPHVGPCPVKVGDRFELRSCVIEITRTSESIKAGRDALWVAEFTRHEQEKVYLLRSAPPAHADQEEATELDAAAIKRAAAESAYTSSQHGALPHEPESVGPDWVDKGKAERVTRLREDKAEMEQKRLNDNARAELGRTLAGLTPERQIELLAYIQRGCEAAKAGGLEEAA